MPVHGVSHSGDKTSKTKRENVLCWLYKMIHETPQGHKNKYQWQRRGYWNHFYCFGRLHESLMQAKFIKINQDNMIFYSSPAPGRNKSFS